MTYENLSSFKHTSGRLLGQTPYCIGRHISARRTQLVHCNSGFVVGIDLGTTNSAVAVVKNGKPKIICTPDGRTTPSVVHYDSEGGVSIGRTAKQIAAQHPGSTFFSTKRLIGRKHQAVQQAARKLPYAVNRGNDGSVLLQKGRDGVPPQEVAAHLLRFLLAAAEAELGGSIQKAVISVPAYFTQEQRGATIAAGKMAGLETVRLIREPVAAALAYGLDLQTEATVLVADLGGGTFDVALLEVGGGTVEVLTTGGDSTLGGDDWDAAIAQHLNAKYLQPAGIRTGSPEFKARLRSLAETAKIALSQQSEVLLRIPGGPGAEPVEAVLTAQQLDKLTAPLYRKALLPLEDACQQAGVDLAAALDSAARDRGGGGGGRKLSHRKKAKAPLDVQLRPKRRPPISEVLLVGGATRMPSFSRFITNTTGLVPRTNAVDPDEAVAVGAAVQAAMLDGQLDDLMVMDVWQAALMRAFATPALEDMERMGTESMSHSDEDAEGAWELLSETFEDEEPQEGEDFDIAFAAKIKAELAAADAAVATNETTVAATAQRRDVD